MGVFAAIAAPLIGGALGYAGTRDTNRTNTANAREANSFSREENQINRDFQTASVARANEFSQNQVLQKQSYDTLMSNTAVSRRMADLKNSGINPILAAKYDASSPSGAVAQGIAASGNTASGQYAMHQNPTLAASTAISSLSNSNLQSSQVSKIDQEIENLAAQEQLTYEQTKVAKEQIGKVAMEIQKLAEEKLKLHWENIPIKLKNQFIDQFAPQIQKIGEALSVKTQLIQKILLN